MSANTTRGWPYPVGTDRVADGDDAIRALAEKADARVGYGACGGSVVLPITAVNTTATVAVTFPVGMFPSNPVVQLTNNVAGAPQQVTPPSVGSLNAAGMSIFGQRTAGSAAYTVQWLAILPA